MNKRDSSKLTRAALLAIAPVVLSLQAMSASAGDRDAAGAYRMDETHYAHCKRHRERTLRGVAVTGVNDVGNQPFFSWGEPYGPFHFPTLGVHNPGGTEALPLDAATPASAVLATYVDPRFLAVSGAKPEDVKPEWLNVPLRNVPVNVDFGFVNRVPLPRVMQSTPLRPAQAEPGTGEITFGQWMSARGTAKISCRGSRADVSLRLKNLIPHRLYTVWATLGLPRDGSAVTFFPIPLGGTPNVFISDRDGRATFDRVIKFCPFEPDSTLRPLLTINVQYHANAQNYGGVPEPGFLHGWWQGVVTFNHVVFPVNVERLPR